jgi:hypothetical protein
LSSKVSWRWRVGFLFIAAFEACIFSIPPLPLSRR